MAIQWTTTGQAGQAHGVKMLVYAGAGAGKTALCATAPRPVVISAEAGLLSLQKKNVERMFGANNPAISYDIPVMQVTSMPQLVEAYQFFAAPRSPARVAPPAVAPAPVKTPAATPARATLAKPTPTKAAAKVSAPQIAPAKTPAASDADGEWESF